MPDPYREPNERIPEVPSQPELTTSAWGHDLPDLDAAAGEAGCNDVDAGENPEDIQMGEYAPEGAADSMPIPAEAGSGMVPRETYDAVLKENAHLRAEVARLTQRPVAPVDHAAGAAATAEAVRETPDVVELVTDESVALEKTRPETVRVVAFATALAGPYTAAFDRVIARRGEAVPPRADIPDRDTDPEGFYGYCDQHLKAIEWNQHQPGVDMSYRVKYFGAQADGQRQHEILEVTTSSTKYSQSQQPDIGDTDIVRLGYTGGKLETIEHMQCQASGEALYRHVSVDEPNVLPQVSVTIGWVDELPLSVPAYARGAGMAMTDQLRDTSRLQHVFDPPTDAFEYDNRHSWQSAEYARQYSGSDATYGPAGYLDHVQTALARIPTTTRKLPREA